MQRSHILLCMTSALVAQAIPQASTPAPTLSLAQLIDGQIDRLDTLKLTDPAQALAEALALIPDPLPTFDKSNIQATRQSLMDQ